MNCVFCKIADKEFQSQIISETETSLAFLDVNPVAPGHTLIIPKSHYVEISATPDEILSELSLLQKSRADSLN